jgi:hypothetical protein
MLASIMWRQYKWAYTYASHLVGSGRRGKQALDDFVWIVVMDCQQLRNVWGRETHLVENVVGLHELLHLGRRKGSYLSYFMNSLE